MTISVDRIQKNWAIMLSSDDVSDLIGYDDESLRRQLYDEKVIVVRGHTGGADEFWRLCAKMGRTMDDTEYDRGLEKHDAIVVDGTTRFYGKISNIISPGLGTYGMPWHADNPDIGVKSYPIRCLRMVTCPNTNAGFTGFLNIERAWSMLDESIKDQWRTYTIVQQSWYEAGTNIEHLPSVKIHLITGNESPLVNHHNHGNVKNAWIKDIIDSNGHSIGCGPMTGLIKSMEAIDGCTYQHRWLEGDIIIYDNHALLHNRTELAISQTEERLMWRINVLHDPTRSLRQHISVPHHHSI